MSRTSTSRHMPLENFVNQNIPALSSIDNLSIAQFSELHALQTMDRLLKSHRRDLLRLRAEYKSLRDEEGAQELASIHIRHKLKNIEDAVHGTLEAYSALKDDYSAQRTCFLDNVKKSGSSKNA